MGTAAPTPTPLSSRCRHSSRRAAFAIDRTRTRDLLCRAPSLIRPTSHPITPPRCRDSRRWPTMQDLFSSAAPPISSFLVGQPPPRGRHATSSTSHSDLRRSDRLRARHQSSPSPRALAVAPPPPRFVQAKAPPVGSTFLAIGHRGGEIHALGSGSIASPVDRHATARPARASHSEELHRRLFPRRLLGAARLAMSSAVAIGGKVARAVGFCPERYARDARGRVWLLSSLRLDMTYYNTMNLDRSLSKYVVL